MHPKYLQLFTTFNFSPLKYNIIFLDRGDFLLKTITTVLFTLIVNKWSLKCSEILSIKNCKDLTEGDNKIIYIYHRHKP